MSGRNSLELVLSPQAIEEVAGILEYTRSQWGQHQRRKYRSELMAGFSVFAIFLAWARRILSSTLTAPGPTQSESILLSLASKIASYGFGVFFTLEKTGNVGLLIR